jgi:uncharacterized protein with GYD domain
MPTYMILARFTDETATSFAARPAVQSAQELLDQLTDLAREEPLAGELQHLFFTTGEHDMVLVATFPRQRKAAAYALAMTRMIGVRTTTIAAFDATEMSEVIDDAIKVDGA